MNADQQRLSAESVAGYCPHGEPYDDKDPCPDDPPRYAESVRHGAQADDPVPNESDCCFPCGYHNCMVEFCEACEGAVVWNETRWEHIDSPADGHTYQSEPPEHWGWVLEERAHIDGRDDA